MRLKHYHLLLIVTLAVASWYLLLPPEVVLPPPAPRPAGVLSMITEPAAGLGPVLGLIRGARSSAELVMYQFQDRFVADALIAAHRRGVKVRVLLNHGYRGQADPLNEPAYAYLMTHGVSVKWTAALFDLTHQKSLIVDGKTVLIMTFNLTPQYYASGREFGIFDTDPHDVQAAKAVFEGDWRSLHARSPVGDGLVWSPGSRVTLLKLINESKQTLRVYNEEMADDQVTSALEAAVLRGVMVQVCMSYATAWKYAFNELTLAGVQVRTYATSATLYIHAKMIIADSSQAFIGSENFSPPSLESNRELGISFKDESLIRQLLRTFSEDWVGARPYILNQ